LSKKERRVFLNLIERRGDPKKRKLSVFSYQLKSWKLITVVSSRKNKKREKG